MRNTAPNRERSRVSRTLLISAVVLVSVALATPSADASRSLPTPFTAALEPELQLPELDLVDAPEADVAGETHALFTPEDLSLLAAFMLLDDAEREHAWPPDRFRLFPASTTLPRRLEQLAISKLASGGFAAGIEPNLWGKRGLTPETWWTSDMYAFVGWAPHMGRDPLGRKTMIFVGEKTIGVMPQIILSENEEDSQTVDLAVLERRVESAVATYWGEQEYAGYDVVFDVAVLNTESAGFTGNSTYLTKADRREGSYPYYFWVAGIPFRPGTALSSSDRLWTKASLATLAHEAGHWMHWSYNLAGSKGGPYSEGYIVPDGLYPNGIMGNKEDRTVHPLDVGAVVVSQGKPIGRYNKHEFVAGYRSVVRDKDALFRDDLLIDRFDITDRRAIREMLQRQYEAINKAGYSPKHSMMYLVNSLARVFMTSSSEKDTIVGVLAVFKELAEVE